MKNKKQKDTKYVHFYNANPKSKKTGDCVIRAISTAIDKSWDEVLDDLTEIAHEIKSIPNDRDCYEVYLEKVGFTKCKQMRKKDNTKYIGYEFIDNFKKNDIILCHIGTHHLTVIKNKKIWDTWDCGYGCVGVYWIKKSK